MRGHYRQLEADGRAGRLTAAELEDVIVLYGRQLIDPPDEAFVAAHIYTINIASAGETGARVKVDLDMWTVEEGRSDLTPTLMIVEVADQVTIEIEDLHVL